MANSCDLSKEKFGFELEFFGMTRERACEITRDVVDNYAHDKLGISFGSCSPVHYVGGAYDKYVFNDFKGRKWTICYDSSIPGPASEKCELNTPVLEYGEIAMLQEVIRAYPKNGGQTNPDRCGIHVHINDSDYTVPQLLNLTHLAHAQEPYLYEALAVSDDRKAQWCKPMSENFLNEIKVKKPQTREELAVAWYKWSTYEGEEHRFTSVSGEMVEHYHQSRYHLFNLHSMFFGKGIEFRAFNATFHAGVCKAFIQLCCALSNRAKACKSCTAKVAESDNHAYTFRCVLLKLGMSGDEFKTARLHLMKHVPGNAAWRNGEATTRNGADAQ